MKRNQITEKSCSEFDLERTTKSIIIVYTSLDSSLEWLFRRTALRHHRDRANIASDNIVLIGWKIHITICALIIWVNTIRHKICHRIV